MLFNYRLTDVLNQQSAESLRLYFSRGLFGTCDGTFSHGDHVTKSWIQAASAMIKP